MVGEFWYGGDDSCAVVAWLLLTNGFVGVLLIKNYPLDKHERVVGRKKKDDFCASQ